MSDILFLSNRCKLCGKYYTQSYLINRHMLVHADAKEFKCPICEKEFKASGDLKVHLRNHETEDPKYTHCCELCGKRFVSRTFRWPKLKSRDTHILLVKPVSPQEAV